MINNFKSKACDKNMIYCFVDDSTVFVTFCFCMYNIGVRSWMKGCGFEPYQRHCVVSFSKTLCVFLT